MLTRSDIIILNRTRLLLRKLSSYGPEDFPSREFSGGKFDEACEAADHAIFNVLVLANTYLGVELTQGELHLPPS